MSCDSGVGLSEESQSNKQKVAADGDGVAVEKSSTASLPSGQLSSSEAVITSIEGDTPVGSEKGSAQVIPSL